MTLQTKSKSSPLRDAIIQAASPYGVENMFPSATEKQVRIGTPSQMAMNGVCKRLQEDKSLFNAVRVRNDGLRAVIIEPIDEIGTGICKDFAVELEESRRRIEGELL